MSQEHGWAVEDLARDLDLVLFELEQRGRREGDLSQEEQAELRRRLERLRDRLQDLAQRILR